jgi:hypothetical protein
MIDLSIAPQSIDGLTLFRDRADGGTWHFLPETPSLRRTRGALDFELTKMRHEDGRPAGKLRLGVELSARPSAVAAASARLRSMSKGLPKLVPVVAERVTCELALWTGADTGGTPMSRQAPTQPPHDVTFDLELAPEAAALMEAGLRAGAAVGSVVYNVRVKGLLPALPARAQIDWRRTVAYLAAQHPPGRPIRHSELRASVNALVESGILRLEVLNDAPDAMEHGLDRVMRLVVSEMFEAVPESAAPADAPPPEPSSRARAGLDHQSYQLRPAPAREGVMRYEFDEPRERVVELMPQASLADMLPRDAAAPVTRPAAEGPA